MDGTMKDEIIDFILRNRISTTEVADCLGKSGAIQGVKPLNRAKFAVGPVRWIYAYNESNWEMHDQIRNIEKGEVVLVEPFDCNERAIFGSLVAKYLLLYRQAAAIVVLGHLRDAHTLIKENYPIWLHGVTPIGCYNTMNRTKLDGKIIHNRMEKYHESIAVCDDSGVVVIPPNNINNEFLEKLNFIEEQEDIWFDCIDRRKWNTYDTVCLKKYLDRSERDQIL